MSGVEWRAVAGWEGHYEVANDGRIRSVDRIVAYIARGGRPAERRFPSVELKQNVNSEYGHLAVDLWAGGRPFRRYVHTLVLAAFVGAAPEGMECRHLNGQPTDNGLSNLAWGTPLENAEDTRRHGTNYESRKTQCVRGHALAHPNLSPGHLARGTRTCLACACARCAVRQNSDLDLQAESDRRYELIIAGAAPVAVRRKRGQPRSRGAAQPGADLTRATPEPSTAPMMTPGRWVPRSAVNTP